MKRGGAGITGITGGSARRRSPALSASDAPNSPFQGTIGTGTSVATTIGGTNTPIPICWGTCKVNALLAVVQPSASGAYPSWIAGATYYVGNVVQANGGTYRCIGIGPANNTAQWQPGIGVSVGQQYNNNGSIYQCIVAGTTAAASTGSNGPWGSGSYIGDNDVVWSYVQGTQGISMSAWLASHLYAVGAEAINGGNVYIVTTGGTSASSGGPTGTGTGIHDGGVIWSYVGVYTAGPSGTGTSVINDNTVLWKYVSAALPNAVYFPSFAAVLCEAPAFISGILWWDKYEYASLNSVGLEWLPNGGTGLDGILLPNVVSIHADQFFALPNGVKPCTDTSQDIPSIAVEVGARLVSFTVTPDVSPADIVVDIVTHTRLGLGLSSGIIDSSVTGAGATSFRTYCDAAGLRLSMLVDSQQSALEVLSTLLAATNSDAVWSSALLKIVPLGDQPITSPAFGSTSYVPVVTPVYSFTPDDFLDKNIPVDVQQRSPADTFNACPVSYIDRSNDYEQLTIEYQDQSDIDARGLVRASVTDLPGIVFPTGAQAAMLSLILAQRSINNVNTYTFKVGWRYVLVEPTDIIAITEPAIGLVAQLLRVTQISETPDGAIQITAEDYQPGAQAATGYQPGQLTGYHPIRPTTAAGLPVLVDNQRIGIGTSVIKKGSLQNGSVDPVNLDWTMTTDEVLTGPTTTTNTGDTYTLANTPLVLNDPNAYLCVMDGGVRVTRGNWTLSGKNVVFALGFIPTGVVTADYAH